MRNLGAAPVVEAITACRTPCWGQYTNGKTWCSCPLLRLVELVKTLVGLVAKFKSLVCVLVHCAIVKLFVLSSGNVTLSVISKAILKSSKQSPYYFLIWRIGTFYINSLWLNLWNLFLPQSQLRCVLELCMNVRSALFYLALCCTIVCEYLASFVWSTKVCIL